VLKIEEQGPRKKSNQDVYDAVNQRRAQPPASPIDNPLDELDQFDVPSPDIPSPMERKQSMKNLNNMDLPEPPSYDVPVYPTQFFDQNVSQPQISNDYIQQITEEIVQEKWDDIMNKVGDIRLWKDKMDTEITSIKQEIMRTQNHFANLQKAVFGKVSEYNDNILNINNEMKAFEKVFEKILNPMTENIRELSRITNKLKTKKI